jgi:phosphoglycerate dehydrogenase-like enzyme
MSDNTGEPINVIVAMDFSDALIEQLRALSPRLNVQRHFPQVPDSAWRDVEILYTLRDYPQPQQAPRLRWVQLHFAGLERALQQPIIQSEQVVVTSASGIHAQQIANYCLMMMLAFNFKLPRMLQNQRVHGWPEDRYAIFEPEDMHRMTLGIAGYGSIGRELARLAKALGMRVLATKRDVKRSSETNVDYALDGIGDPKGEIPDRIYPGEALPTMAAECDFLVLAVPYTEDTHHMVDARVLEAMKASGILINIARGGVVDEEALAAALREKQIGGAALDVFETEPLPQDSPLWDMNNVIISPHVAGNSLHYHQKVADLFTENLQRYLENRPLLNKLNRSAGY